MQKIVVMCLCLFSFQIFAATQVEEELAIWKSLTMEQIDQWVSEDDGYSEFIEDHPVEKILLAIEPELRSVGIDPRFVRKYFDQISKRLYVEYVKKEPYKVNQLLNRVERFFPFFHRELKRSGLVKEYAAISLIESMLIPDIKSIAAAVGLWQFIPTTAEHFKIFKCQKWRRDRKGRVYCPKVLFDHRDNVSASTEAALRFIQNNLKKIVEIGIPENLRGLALLTSYNGGFGKVQNMLNACAAKDLFIHCEISKLPQETQLYSMRFVAALYFLKIYAVFPEFNQREYEAHPCLRRQEGTLTSQTAEALAREKKIDLNTFYYYNKNPLNNIYLMPHEKYVYENGARGCETPDEYYSSKFYVPKIQKKFLLNNVDVSSHTKSAWSFVDYDKKTKRRLLRLQKRSR